MRRVRRDRRWRSRSSCCSRAHVRLVVVVAVALAYVDARRRPAATGAARSLDVARRCADAADRRAGAAATRTRPTWIQPYAERVRRDTRTDFVVVMGLDRTRYSHPNPSQIGEPFIGDLGGRPTGDACSPRSTPAPSAPPCARSSRSATGGQVVALVSVGITLENVDRALERRLLPIVLAAVALIGIGGAGAWLISRRLRRQTHGLGRRRRSPGCTSTTTRCCTPCARGCCCSTGDGRVQLVNDEAAPAARPPRRRRRPPRRRARPAGRCWRRALRRHAGRGRDPPGRRPGARGQPGRGPVGGPTLGTVVTLRDHTELRAVTGELDTVRGLAEALRAQNHEAANRLHTVVSLIELGRRRRGGGVRDRGARARPAAHRPRGRRVEGAGGRRAAARQVGAGRRARHRPASSTRTTRRRRASRRARATW